MNYQSTERVWLTVLIDRQNTDVKFDCHCHVSAMSNETLRT